jgi:GntR family transcriptional regulator/MocR family aminotransferase
VTLGGSRPFLGSGQFVQHLRRTRRLYRERRDALRDALDRQFGDTAAVHGAGTGMHLSLRFADPAWRDDRISDAAQAAGIVAHCMTRHETGLRKTGWNGLLLGYSQVPAAEIHDAVGLLAAIAFHAAKSHPTI